MDIKIKEQIIELRRKGLTYNEIRDITKVKKATISDIVKPLNLGGNAIKKLTPELIEEIQAKYNEIGNLKKVVKLYHISFERLSKVIKHGREKKVSNVEAVESWRKRKKKTLVEYKGGKCQCCGYSRCIEALEFHHLNPNIKNFTISGKSKSFNSLKSEVDKCILVCSNCHKEIHAGLININNIINQKVEVS